jgi:hypothetical protein
MARILWRAATLLASFCAPVVFAALCGSSDVAVFARCQKIGRKGSEREVMGKACSSFLPFSLVYSSSPPLSSSLFPSLVGESLSIHCARDDTQCRQINVLRRDRGKVTAEKRETLKKKARGVISPLILILFFSHLAHWNALLAIHCSHNRLSAIFLVLSLLSPFQISSLHPLSRHHAHPSLSQFSSPPRCFYRNSKERQHVGGSLHFPAVGR